MASNEKNKQTSKDIGGVLLGAGLTAGAVGFEELPDKYKYFKQRKEIKPLSKAERILIVTSDPAFGSGHQVQGKALEKELKRRGYSSVVTKTLQELHPAYNQGGKEIALKYYQVRKNSPLDQQRWADNITSINYSGANRLAKDIKNYDRIFFLTGDVGESVAKPFSKLRRALLKKDAPYSHYIYTDRGVTPYNSWWNKSMIDPSRPVAGVFDSHFIPDQHSYNLAIENEYYKDKYNPKRSIGLAIDIDDVAVPDKRLRPKYFIHGGSTGVNVSETAENLLRALKENKAKGNALIVFGKSNLNKDKVNTLKAQIDEFNRSGARSKIHYVDSLDKPTMNYYLHRAPINFTAGGTSYEELGRLGKPSLFTYTDKNKIVSHPTAIMGRTEIADQFLQDYIKNRKALSEIPGTEVGIGRLTGSDLIDSSDYEAFSKRLQDFEKDFTNRKQIAKSNVSQFGLGAPSIIDELEKGDKVVKYKHRIMPRTLTALLGAAGGGFAGKKLVDLLSDDKDKGFTWKHGLGLGAGLAVGAALPHTRTIARIFRDTNKFRKYNPDAPILRQAGYMSDYLKTLNSEAAKHYRKIK